MKIHHAQSKREVDSSDGIGILGDGHELALREDLSVIFEFFQRVGFFGGVDQLANLDDGFVIRGGTRRIR